MEPLFMIKYGEKAHLEQLINGAIRFTPSQTYIKLEEKQHNKGQGDLLEGKMIIHMQGAQVHDINTHELIGTLPKATITMSIQDVSDMPIFCLSQYDKSDTVDFINKEEYTISISEDKLNCIKEDFPKADFALIIFEPDKFISDVKNILNRSVFANEIKYFDYDINSLQMVTFVAKPSSENPREYSLTYENRYRHLLCKDRSFSLQNEFRFIITDEAITKPTFYEFTFTSNYLVIPINELKNGVHVNFLKTKCENSSRLRG